MWRGFTGSRFRPRRRGAGHYYGRGYRHVAYRGSALRSPEYEKAACDGSEMERIESRFLFDTKEEAKSEVGKEVGVQTDGITDIKINQLSQELLKKNAAIRSYDVSFPQTIRKLSALWTRSCRRSGGRLKRPMRSCLVCCLSSSTDGWWKTSASSPPPKESLNTNPTLIL
eukprot:TRINITY_DN3305_c0_g1_i11.p1 TRINITY_DN3305_c0_g1~~TRINITY_DN3305_c0_g1_i11.p1  ORF type:complete len:170 (-),score=22.01 TRINITY_DN3305_c0_g1_i11:275-784(-)